MPVITAAEGAVHEVHGARFTSYATSATGSTELAAWRLEIPAGSRGVPHTISREEVFLVQAGELAFSIDDEQTTARAGDVVIAPAGCRLAVHGSEREAGRAWVTTRLGLRAELADGTVLSPPWAA
ncbi:cupin domain-containing protein [Kitasatospora sp. NPDC052896]|uniref:cupin domain-containing protein n=1 Tax=Kitasatospora sp. NPDC052896 TaxID=3364061 RepID=UPI0037C6E9EB